jgi:hypothetical protein
MYRSVLTKAMEAHICSMQLEKKGTQQAILINLCPQFAEIEYKLCIFELIVRGVNGKEHCHIDQ